jgi:hypothetical protein
MVDTNITYTQKDEGKNLYRKKTYYTLVIEQEVLAKDKDEADNLFTDNGIDHSKITSDITETKDGVETYMVDANYNESGDTEYVGKVVFDTDTYGDEAIENGDVTIDTYADENDLSEKEKSDVDTAINLEWEQSIGK